MTLLLRLSLLALTIACIPAVVEAAVGDDEVETPSIVGAGAQQVEQSPSDMDSDGDSPALLNASPRVMVVPKPLLISCTGYCSRHSTVARQPTRAPPLV